jgi:hypothetical protein
MVAMDDAAMSIMTGGPGLSAVTAVTCWVTKRMHPMGAIRNDWIRSVNDDKAVGYKANVALLR